MALSRYSLGLTSLVSDFPSTCFLIRNEDPLWVPAQVALPLLQQLLPRHAASPPKHGRDPLTFEGKHDGGAARPKLSEGPCELAHRVIAPLRVAAIIKRCHVG